MSSALSDDEAAGREEPQDAQPPPGTGFTGGGMLRLNLGAATESAGGESAGD